MRFYCGRMLRMLKGKLVHLDTIEEEDLETLRSWRNFEDFKKYFREYREISKTMQKKWFDNIVNNNNQHQMFAIRSVETNELLGCCGLTFINWVHKHADLSFYIGHEKKYIDDEGYSKESVKLLFEFGFNQLALNKIWAEIYEFDELKINIFDELELKLDGILRENYYYSGKYYNSLIYSLLSSEFKLGPIK